MAKASKTPKEKLPVKQRVTFSLSAPDAAAVLLTGSFCDWEMNSVTLTKGPDGVWKKMISLAPGRYEYRFLVDGQWHDDPAATERVANDFGTENCVLHVAG